VNPTISRVRSEVAVGPGALGLSESEFDVLLDRLIQRERERVADAVEVSLGTVTTTETLSRPEHVAPALLPLPDRPVQSVSSVTLDSERVGGPDVIADQYVVTDTHIELRPGADRQRWPTARRSIEVTWTHGYPESEMPQPVAGAIIGLVRQALVEIDGEGITSESIDGQSVDYELPEQVVARHLSRAASFDEPTFYGGSNII
jgi:hypothetical protein